jgi:F1F0 ATPase subunit 2
VKVSVTTAELALVALGGAALGTLHFVGLWCTVRRLPRTRHPGVLVLFSSVLRIAVSMVGLWALMAAEPARLIAALVAFLLARVLLGARLGAPWEVKSRPD